MIRRLGAVLLILTFVVGSAGTAQAREDSISEMSEQELYNLNNNLTFSTSETVNSTTASCKGRTRAAKAYFANGALAWSFHQTVNWCWKSGKVTSVTWSNWGVTGSQIYNLWSYDGISSRVNGGCVGCAHVYRRTYGHFHFCVTWVCNHRYPFVSHTVRGDGTYASDASIGGSGEV